MPQRAGTRSTSPKDPDRQGRGGRPALLSRERILDVARQIPARELTMPMVARRLEVSAPALYRHFESRDALLAALGSELAEKFELRPANPVGWREWLLDTNVSLFRFLVDNPVILAVPDWTYVAGMGDRLLDTAHATLEGAGFDPVTATEVWGVVSGHAYLGARILHDAPQADPAALHAVNDALRGKAGEKPPRGLALAKARGTADPHELLVHSLRWLVSVLPEPGQAPHAIASPQPAPRRKQCARRVPGGIA